MGHIIAVMNTKGGVGKSTTAMMLSEALASQRGMRVLVIDSDPQTSISTMLLLTEQWEEMDSRGKTFAHLLEKALRGARVPSIGQYIRGAASNVVGAQSLCLIPGHMQLAVVDRKITKAGKELKARAILRELANRIRNEFDVAFVDCPPGVTELTEAWLLTADFFLPPTKPDFVSVRGLTVLHSLKADASFQGADFAKDLGVLITMKETNVTSHMLWHRRLEREPKYNCFPWAIPKRVAIQSAAECSHEMLTFRQKYPGDLANIALRTADILMQRISEVADGQRRNQNRARGSRRAAK